MQQNNYPRTSMGTGWWRRNDEGSKGWGEAQNGQLALTFCLLSHFSCSGVASREQTRAIRWTQGNVINAGCATMKRTYIYLHLSRDVSCENRQRKDKWKNVIGKLMLCGCNVLFFFFSLCFDALKFIVRDTRWMRKFYWRISNSSSRLSSR